MLKQSRKYDSSYLGYQLKTGHCVFGALALACSCHYQCRLKACAPFACLSRLKRVAAISLALIYFEEINTMLMKIILYLKDKKLL